MADRLVSRVTRYKRGTARLVSWLVESARKAEGGFLEVREPIPTKHLEDFADSIVRAKPPIGVPFEILVITQDVIDGRNACARYFSRLEHETGKPATAIEESVLSRQNDGHRHFIDVLQGILNKLKEAYERPRAKKNTKPKNCQDDIEKSIVNVFEYLQLSDPKPTKGIDTAHTTSTPHRAPTAPAISGNSNTYRLDTAEQDTALDIWSLLKDLADIRACVKDVWLDFYQGKITSAVALVVTEAAVNMSANIDKAFQDAHPDLYSAYRVIQFLQIDVDIQLNGAFRASNPKDGDQGDIADLLCIEAWATLAKFLCAALRRHLDDQELPRWYSMFDVGPMTPFASALLDMEQELYAERRRSPVRKLELDLGCHPDGFTTGLTMLTESPAAPVFWFLSATKMYMDISSALGLNTERVFNETSRAAITTSASIRDLLTMKQRSSSIELNRTQLERYVSQISGFSQPDGGALHVSTLKLLKGLPMLCNGAVTPALLGSHEISIVIANGESALLAFAYLYKAAQISGLLKEKWPDMDFVIQQQSRSGNFVCESRDLDGLYRNYSRAMGIKPSEMQKLFRSKYLVPPLSKMKKLQSTSRAIIAYHQMSARDSRHINPGADVLNYMYFLADSNSKSKGRNHGRPIAELLKALQTVHAEDELGINFHYVGLWSRCLSFLHKLFENPRFDIKRLCTDGTEMNCSAIVHGIMWEAVMAKSKERQNTILYRVGPAIQTIIATEGDKWLTEARSMSSGHIPEAAKPCNNWKWFELTDERVRENDVSHRLAVVERKAQIYCKTHLRDDLSLSIERKLELFKSWYLDECKRQGIEDPYQVHGDGLLDELILKTFCYGEGFAAVLAGGSFQVKIPGKLPRWGPTMIYHCLDNFLDDERLKNSSFLLDLDDSMPLAAWLLSEEADAMALFAAETMRLLRDWVKQAGLVFRVSADGGLVSEGVGLIPRKGHVVTLMNGVAVHDGVKAKGAK